MTFERLLSTEEAAELLGMNRSWLDHARLGDYGPAWTRIGRNVKYRPEDLRTFIAQNRTDPTSENANERPRS